MAGSPAGDPAEVLGAMYDHAGGDWEQLTQADRDDLLQMAYGHAPASGAHAWAVLLLLNEVDSVPMPELPGLFKSYLPRKAYRADALEQPPIGVLPNPASDRIAFTYADGLENGVLEVFDAQGRLMRTIPLNGRRGLVESNVQGWSEGLYVVRLVLEGHNLGSTKFNVVR